MFLAIIHFLGSILVTIAFWLFLMMLASRRSQSMKKSILDDFSFQLGVPAERLNDDAMSSKILALIAQRYSNETLSNRLADFCGSVDKLWGWLGLTLQVCVLLGVMWSTLAEDVHDSLNFWFIPAIGFFFSCTSLLFSSGCRLFTGRYPGEAKHVRDSLIQSLTNRSGV